MRLDNEAFIISGGLAAVSTRDGDIAQIDFLRRVSALGGNKLVNAIGYHPYTYPLLPSLVTSFHTPWDRIDRAPVSLHSVLVRYGTPDLPFWLTEYGAPTGGPGSGSSGAQSSSTTHVTEARQAQILVDAVNTAWARRPHPGALHLRGQGSRRLALDQRELLRHPPRERRAEARVRGAPQGAAQSGSGSGLTAAPRAACAGVRPAYAPAKSPTTASARAT